MAKIYTKKENYDPKFSSSNSYVGGAGAYLTIQVAKNETKIGTTI